MRISGDACQVIGGAQVLWEFRAPVMHVRLLPVELFMSACLQRRMPCCLEGFMERSKGAFVNKPVASYVPTFEGCRMVSREPARSVSPD
jgi:hypothetical protein